MLVGGEVALERRDDRDAAADAGLVENVDAGAGGHRQELRAVLGHHFLVAGHDVAALLQRALDEAVRRLLAADDLDDDVAVGESASSGSP